MRRRAIRGHYQEQDSAQTLAEGLAEYYALNSGLIARPESLAPESAELFRSHDLCHVIFGLDTNDADEAMADTRTLLSCDVGWRRYARYMTADRQAKEIFAQLGLRRAVGATITALPRMILALIEVRRSPRRWPWAPPADHMGRTLADLRAEYGIRLV